MTVRKIKAINACPPCSCHEDSLIRIKYVKYFNSVFLCCMDCLKEKVESIEKTEHWLFHDVKKLSFWYDNDNMAMLFFKSDTHRKIYG